MKTKIPLLHLVTIGMKKWGKIQTIPQLKFNLLFIPTGAQRNGGISVLDMTQLHIEKTVRIYYTLRTALAGSQLCTISLPMNLLPRRS